MTAIVYHEFATQFSLDAAALNFLSAAYYYTKETQGPFTKTQKHLQNITGCTQYQQRRIRKQLEKQALLTVSRKMELTEKGHRTRLYYTANTARLDALLDEVNAKKAALKAQSKQASTPKPEQPVEPPKPVIQPVKMHAEWQPDIDQLAAFLNDYDIQAKFVTHFALPEFRGYWSDQDREHTENQWQVKFHEDILRKWNFHIAKEKRAAIINAAADEHANAVANLKSKKAQKINTEANSRYKTTAEKLLDTSWADDVDIFDYQSDAPFSSDDIRTYTVDSDTPYHQPYTQSKEEFENVAKAVKTARDVVDLDIQADFLETVATGV